MPDLKTIRRWIHHFIKFGETPTETRKYRTRSGRRKWTSSDIAKLLEIVAKEPDLYLDEIRNRLITQTGKAFHTSSIFKSLKENNFSLKVAYEKAIQRDEIERSDWRRFIEQRGPDVGNQIVFIDETHKGPKDGRRRRHWIARGFGQPFNKATFIGGDNNNRYDY